MKVNDDIKNLATLFTEQVVVPKGKMEIGDIKNPDDESGAIAAVKAANIDELEEGPAVNHTQAKPKPIRDFKEGVKHMIPNSTFDALFRDTINEQEEMMDDVDLTTDATEEDFSGEETGDEDINERVDVATRLEMVIDDLSSIVSAIRGESDDESIEDFEDDSFDDSETSDDDEANLGEAVFQPEPKELGDSKGKKLAAKGNIKVGGVLNKAASAAQNIGKLTNSPEPRLFPNTGKKLMGKGNIKVKSPGIKQGNPIHT